MGLAVTAQVELANRRLQPLGHSSVGADMPDTGASRKQQISDGPIPGCRALSRLSYGARETVACYLCNIQPKTSVRARSELLLYVARAGRFDNLDLATEGGNPRSSRS
jgi:hypothetical protein